MAWRDSSGSSRIPTVLREASRDRGPSFCSSQICRINDDRYGTMGNIRVSVAKADTNRGPGVEAASHLEPISVESWCWVEKIKGAYVGDKARWAKASRY